ncbi:FtsB family cell division protein [Methylocella silvestris]|uniref:Septation inhibitor protein n=1 Tax=Methylocella silvestris TaxID=199596 RepID=A0A2J7TDK1_METSI|nr:septation inhibitor protein [Methylocella silvestris]PNG24841.1 septation inhibitor protein [Methylocella silvestris]
MVIRRRLRAILFPLLLYCVSGAAGGYFVWHALNGERGLKTNDEYQIKIAGLQNEIDGLRTESALWRRRIALINGAIVDRDLLDEETRALIGRADKNDLVVLLPPAQ